MMRCTILMIAACLIAALAWTQDDFLKERSEGFLLIFNGLNPQGWTISEGGGWKVEDSTLVAGADARWIRTDHNAFGDYVLRFEWKCSERGQAALLLRGEEHAAAAVNLGDRAEGSGGLDGAHLRPRKRMDSRCGEWNRMEVRVQASTVAITLNGEMIVPKSPISAWPDRGPLAFVNFSGALALRAIRLRPLGLDVPFFIQKVQPTFKIQCVGCHTNSSGAGRKFPLEIPDLGNYDDAQIMKDYLEAARRVKPGDPAGSLLLAKALGTVNHSGGRQFAVNSPEHKAFAAWIRGESIKK